MIAWNELFPGPRERAEPDDPVLHRGACLVDHLGQCSVGGRARRIGHLEQDMRGHVPELLAKSLSQAARNGAVTVEDRVMLLEGSLLSVPNAIKRPGTTGRAPAIPS